MSFLHIGDNVLRLRSHFVQRDNDFNFVLAAFNKGHVQVFAKSYDFEGRGGNESNRLSHSDEFGRDDRPDSKQFA